MKKSVVGVYINHHRAIEAVKQLLNSDFSKNDITIIGRVEDINGDMHLPSGEIENRQKPAAIGGVIGVFTGILTGIGIFAIPGLGFLYGAGALIGAIAGFDLGLISGGLVSIVETLAEEEHRHSLMDYLKRKHHLVVYTGPDKHKVEEMLKNTDSEEVFH